MLELLQSLLAVQPIKSAAAQEVETHNTEVVAPKTAPTPAPILTVAPPELMPVKLSAPASTIEPLSLSVSATPPLLSQATHSAATLKIAEISAAPEPKTPQKQDSITNTVAEGSEQAKNTANIAENQKQQTAKDASSPSSKDIVVNSSKVETSTLTQKLDNPAKGDTPSASRQAESDRQNATPQLSEPAKTKTDVVVEILTQPEVEKPNVRQAPSERVLERQKIIGQRLAEIVTKDKSQKEAQIRERLISNAYGYATRGKFDQARQLLKDPMISATVQEEVAKNLNSLEAESRKIGVVQATEHVRAALKQRQIQRREQEILRSIPSIPPLPTKTQKTVTARRAPLPQYPAVRTISSTPTGVQRLPQAATNSSSSRDRQYSVTTPTTPELQAYNRTLSAPDNLNPTQALYPLPAPVPVTSKFGWRVHPVTGSRRFHAGVDLGAPQGTPVLATREGRIKIADNLGGYGLAIVLEQVNGKQDALYAHLSEMFVRPGEKVKPGTIIGRVGSTGLSTGPHLHYELRKRTASGWVTTDPSPQLEAAKVQLMQAQANARNAAMRQNRG